MAKDANLHRELRQILSRFRIAEIPYVVGKWRPLSKESHSVEYSRGTKKDFIEQIAKRFKHGKLTPKDVAELDLLYLQKHKNSKLWKVMEVKPIPGDNPNDVSTAKMFGKRLRAEVELYLNADVHCVQHNNAYWTRIAIYESKSSKASNVTVVYIVFLPNTSYFIVTGLKASHKDYILQSLMTVLHGHGVVDVNLSGHCLLSLIRLILSKHTNGAGIFLGGDPRPVTEETLPENVFNENIIEKQHRDQYVSDWFGPKKLPCLEKIVYRLETKFKGLSDVPSMAKHDSVFHCQIKFEGPSVLEGIRNLAAAGLAELPMKTHLVEVHKMAKNEFLLKPISK